MTASPSKLISVALAMTMASCGPSHIQADMSPSGALQVLSLNRSNASKVRIQMAAWATELPTTATSDHVKAAHGNNAFAIELYRQLCSQSGNLFFSPESISTVLAMTYSGARADTAAEMTKTLHFTLPPQRLHRAMGALLRDRNVAHGGYQLKEADALWLQTGYSPLPEFLKLSKDNYLDGLNQMDFKGATEASRQAINRWAAGRTESRIR